MSCNYACKECERKVYVSDITFATGVLTLNFPDTMAYVNGCKYCFVLTTNLPDEATVNAPVVVTVGAGTTTFPLLSRCGAQVIVQQLRKRRRYPFKVSTTATGGSVTILCCLPEVDGTTLAALNDAVDGGAGA